MLNADVCIIPVQGDNGMEPCNWSPDRQAPYKQNHEKVMEHYMAHIAIAIVGAGVAPYIIHADDPQAPIPKYKPLPMTPEERQAAEVEANTNAT